MLKKIITILYDYSLLVGLGFVLAIVIIALSGCASTYTKTLTITNDPLITVTYPTNLTYIHAQVGYEVDGQHHFNCAIEGEKEE